jgi:hypothetical protein
MPGAIDLEHLAQVAEALGYTSSKHPESKYSDTHLRIIVYTGSQLFGLEMHEYWCKTEEEVRAIPSRLAKAQREYVGEKVGVFLGIVLFLVALIIAAGTSSHSVGLEHIAIFCGTLAIAFLALAIPVLGTWRWLLYAIWRVPEVPS